MGHGNQDCRGDRAIEQGAQEVDYVINISSAIAGDFESIQSEMSAMRELELSRGVTVKVIFENAVSRRYDKNPFVQDCQGHGYFVREDIYGFRCRF